MTGGRRVADRTAGYSCPKCSRPLGVVDSRPTTFMGEKTVRRRRICETEGGCGHRFSTYEISEDNLAGRLRRDELLEKTVDATLSAIAELSDKLKGLFQK